MDTSDEAWNRAVSYPYDRPPGSFVFKPSSRTTFPLRTDALAELLADRRPLLAIGSNAAPERLAQKFPGGPEIPVVAATLHDHDVVFAALLTHYGSVPATFVPSPGTSCEIHVTFLDAEQVAAMHASENVGSAYDLVTVDPSSVSCDAPMGEPPRAYRARGGPLCVDGTARSLAAIPATGRQYEEWTELRALQWVARLRDTTVRELIASTASAHRRNELKGWLEAYACR